MKMNRRDILQLSVGTLAGILGGFYLGKKNFRTVRLEPVKRSDESFHEPLKSYIQREADNIEVLPYSILGLNDFVRYRASVTFERYLSFYRFKNQVLESSGAELEDCVKELEEMSPRAKALVLLAIVIFDLTRHRNSFFTGRYKDRIVTYADAYHMFESQFSDNGTDRNGSSVHYYPFLYPYRESRVFMILGRPWRDRSISEKTWNGWKTVFDSYASDDEVAFPPLTLDDSLPGMSELSLDETKSEYQSNPVQLQMDRHALLDPRLHALCLSPDPDLDSVLRDCKRLWLWNQWMKNIDSCSELVKKNTGLEISSEKWICDGLPYANMFLSKAAYWENPRQVDPFRREEILALREYWISLQSPFDKTALFTMNSGPFIPVDFAEMEGFRICELVNFFNKETRKETLDFLKNKSRR